ncbi:MAG: MBL fold metallo-hydrolase [Desulfurococcales archaeon]|nr:MBL fold metallo-hydrolase [Desulfurococcales archaeon]
MAGKDCVISVGDVDVEIVWFDSMGAKSSSILVKTPSVSILVDPGIAVMHPSFPASYEDKIRWFNEGYRRILTAAKEADVITLTHYHYDHFIDFEPRVYIGKTILAKNPNKYINDSQRKRALSFYKNLLEHLGYNLETYLSSPQDTLEIPDPLKHIPKAMAKDYGDYSSRKKELIKKGLKWFWGRVEKWRRYPIIPELRLGKTRIFYADNKCFSFGRTRICFSRPLFHGIEFSRVGWILMVMIEYKGIKIMHTSDVNGPIIEDYVDYILSFKPDILFLDGPPTYLLGYTMNRINLGRAINNGLAIIDGLTDKKPYIIYDHHVVREKNFIERTKPVWRKSAELGVFFKPASNICGYDPVVLGKQ